jgi:hypothetical protein
VLADGQWHDRQELLDAARTVVPPAVAYRRAEAHRMAERGQPIERIHGDEHQAIKTGKNQVASAILYSLVRSGTVKREGDRYRIVRASGE